MTELKKQARPRLKWTELTLREKWKEATANTLLTGTEFNANEETHIDILSVHITKLAKQMKIFIQ